MRSTIVMFAVFICVPVCRAQTVQPLAGWSSAWAREAGKATAIVDGNTHFEKKPSIRIEYTGQKDWALNRQERVAVRDGDIVELSVQIMLQGPNHAGISVTTYDKAGKAVEWTYGDCQATATAKWKQLSTRFIVPKGIASIQPRITGYQAATVWLAAYSCKIAGNVQDMIDKSLPPQLTLHGKTIDVTFNTADSTFTVLDRRIKRIWQQKAVNSELVLKSAKAGVASLELTYLHLPTLTDLRVIAQADPNVPEFTVSVSGNTSLHKSLSFPHPFAGSKGDYLVVPMNEGISYPVDDESIHAMRLIAYGGHGICMGFWGVTDGNSGHMAILETPDDSSIDIRRVDGLLAISSLWDAQKGNLGYPRKLRYVFFDSGGHVAMCKRYRAWSRQAGLFKTLEQKRKEIPSVDFLIGAVNVWCWEKEPLSIVKELQAAGIERILWSNQGRPESIRAMNEMPNVLTSRYDIYQDCMNPANFSRLRWIHADWTSDGWPKDIMINAAGDWVHGWEVETRDGNMIPCGVLCDRQAISYADKRIAEDLKTHPYHSRFIDTTTASPWRECYSPDHPMTRTESKQSKMELLQTVSEKFKMVTGCETGHEASVPYLHYFEGMMSLGPYRVHDAGRKMQNILQDVPPQISKFQLGHQYRLPLWELVYHDCVVAQWYWGDYNNKLPAVWDKRDLFNVLYATPPMFMFNRSLWKENKDRFVQSYKNTCPYVRAVGYSEMTDHRFLTPDRSVQQTRFANGVTITVNFSETTYQSADTGPLKPGAFHVHGMSTK